MEGGKKEPVRGKEKKMAKWEGKCSSRHSQDLKKKKQKQPKNVVQCSDEKKEKCGRDNYYPTPTPFFYPLTVLVWCHVTTCGQ